MNNIKLKPLNTGRSVSEISSEMPAIQGCLLGKVSLYIIDVYDTIKNVYLSHVDIVCYYIHTEQYHACLIIIIIVIMIIL